MNFLGDASSILTGKSGGEAFLLFTPFHLTVSLYSVVQANCFILSFRSTAIV